MSRASPPSNGSRSRNQSSSGGSSPPRYSSSSSRQSPSGNNKWGNAAAQAAERGNGSYGGTAWQDEDRLNDEEYVQHETKRVQGESLSSSRRALARLNEASAMAEGQLSMLNSQSEQFNRMEAKLDEANASAKNVDAKVDHLKSLNKLFFLPSFGGKKATRKEEEFRRQKEAQQFDSKTEKQRNKKWDERTERLAKNEDRLNQSSRASGSNSYRTTPDGLERDAVEEEIDSNLGMMSSGLARLKMMGMQMGEELQSQDDQLKRIDERTSTTTDKVSRLNSKRQLVSAPPRARTPPPVILALKEISPNVNRTISIKPSPIKNVSAKRRLVVLDSDSSEDDAIPAVKYSEPTANSFKVAAAFIPIPVSTYTPDSSPSESSTPENILPAVYPLTEPTTTLPAAFSVNPSEQTTAPIVAVNEFYSNPLVVITPGPVNLSTLPIGRYLHGAIDADGNCLFSALSFSLTKDQFSFGIYRSYGLKYISDNPAAFEEDIRRHTKYLTVEKYIKYMTPHGIYGDHIMLMALCISLETSITLYQQNLSLIDVLEFHPTSGNTKNHAEIYLDLYAYHYDVVLSAPLKSSSLNSDSAVEHFPKEKEYSEMLCDDAAIADSAVDEKYIYIGRTIDSVENTNPDLSAASSSSSDASEPVAKKVKVDLPHTRQHLGKTYLLSDYGLKNFKKLLDNKQMVVKGKKCQECLLQMDWRIDGPIQFKKRSGIFYYRTSHNGKCVKKGQNDPAIAYDKEFKQMESKLIVLNSKKDKTKEDLDLIATLTARREICFQKGKNSKSEKAAKDARAAGMCPGAYNNGCPLKAKAPVVNSRQKIYCSNCQKKVAANNDNVLESQRKAAERAEGVIVAVPHAESMKTLGAVKSRSLIPASSVSMLQKDLVGIDTSSTGQGSCDWEDLNGVGGFFIDSSGIEHTFLAKRTYATQKRSIEGKWSVSIDGAASQSVLFVPMLKSFAKWCSGRIICYHTAATECDFKRLTSVFTEKTASLVSTVNPFPPFETGWLNTGQDIYRHLLGPKNVPIVSTYWKLSIIHDDLYSLKSDPSVSTPIDTDIVSVESKI